MVIGIAGTIGAGKGTIVRYLVEKKGFTHYSSSTLLKEMLRERGLPATRTHLSPLADELMRQYEGGVLQLSYERAKKEGVQDFVLEAIHRESEADYVRKKGGLVIGVDADITKRYERSTARREGEKDNVTYEEFLEHAKREEEGAGDGCPNIRAVLTKADVVLMNNGTPEELERQLEDFFAQRKEGRP